MYNKSVILTIISGILILNFASARELTYFELEELEKIKREEGIEVSRELLFFLSLDDHEQERYISFVPQNITAVKVFKKQVDMQKEAYREGAKMAKDVKNKLNEQYERQAKELAGLSSNMKDYFYNENDLDY